MVLEATGDEVPDVEQQLSGHELPSVGAAGAEMGGVKRRFSEESLAAKSEPNAKRARAAAAEKKSENRSQSFSDFSDSIDELDRILLEEGVTR